jgi:hypothetical protein
MQSLNTHLGDEKLKVQITVFIILTKFWSCRACNNTQVNLPKSQIWNLQSCLGSPMNFVIQMCSEVTLFCSPVDRDLLSLPSVLLADL